MSTVGPSDEVRNVTISLPAEWWDILDRLVEVLCWVLKSAKVERDEAAERIKALLKENELDCYVLKGKKFFIEPGEPSVKVVKVKQNG